MSKLTHLDEQGRAHMVDVGAKPDTERVAVACGEVHMKKETFDLIRDGQIKKGDVLNYCSSTYVIQWKSLNAIPFVQSQTITEI